MKTHLKLLIMTLSTSAFMNCKKADCEPVSAPNAASSHADTTASELAAEGTEEKTEAVGGTTSGSQRKYLRRKTHQKRLTQYK